MPTIGEALGAVEADLFVGRERHLAEFRRWLAAGGDHPSILNVTGPGGVGKTALLAVFQRTARSAGRSVLAVDGRDLVPLPDAFLAALSPGEDGAIETINRGRALLMLDTFEELDDLTPYLQHEFLPRLDTGVGVVIAGRYPLGPAWASWQKFIRPLVLGGLTRQEGEALLERRGITDPALVDQIIAATGGLALALSLAADMVQQLGVERFQAGREWPLAVRRLVERLLEDVQDPTLRELLEACAVIRQFDEQTLEAVSGRTGIGTAFDRLCRLSVVRPAEHGLMLHDDIRRILADDLRWRQPARHRALRMRALSHYRDRTRSAPPSEREWLVAERLFLWGNELLQQLMFRTSWDEDVYLEPADRSSLPEMEAIWKEYLSGLGQVGWGAEHEGVEQDGERAWRASLAAHPAARIRMARTAEGRAVGYSASIPVYAGSADLLLSHPVFAPLLAVHLGPEGMTALPEDPGRSPYRYLLHAAAVPDLAGPAQAALLRDLMGQLAAGGAFLTTVTSPDRRRLCEAMGFGAVPGARVAVSPGVVAQGYALDLREVGVEAWLEGLIRGKPARPLLHAPDVERELQSVASSWTDDGVLAASPLADVAGAEEAEHARAEAVRRLFREALAAARAGAPDRGAAFKAVEMAYLDRSVSHERVAERMAVSRSTFYRLLKRGIQGMARALVQGWEGN